MKTIDVLKEIMALKLVINRSYDEDQKIALNNHVEKLRAYLHAENEAVTKEINKIGDR